MREIIFKELTSSKAHKRDISIEEIVDTSGLVSSTQKRSTYFIMDSHHVESEQDLQEWIAQKKKDKHVNKKFFHILRNYSNRDKEDSLMCKMRGAFFAVVNQEIYNIVFIHTIKIKVHKEKGMKGK